MPPLRPHVRLAVLMTCHNRRALTVRCLESLRAQQGDAGIVPFVVDDGSSDGTAEAVRAAWPGAQVIAGDGSLFWNGGMRLAWETAATAGPFDHYLWLNDDVVLEPDAIDRLLREAAALAEADGAIVLAGSTRSPGTDEASYGGQQRSDPSRPLRLSVAPPGAAPIAVESVSGNIVLVSAAAFARLGNLSPDFVHIFGDLDYGFRARRADVPVYAGSGFFGTCEGPDMRGTSLDPRLSRLNRLRLRWREERKVHARDWRTFVARHGGAGPLRMVYSLTPWWRILRTPRTGKRLRRLEVLDAGSFDHPSYVPVKGIEDALVRKGLRRVGNASKLERVWSRAIIRFDLTRSYLRVSRPVRFVVVMNLPARRFYPQGWWSDTIVYGLDCWSGRYDEWERFLRRNRVLQIYFNASDSAREFSRRFPHLPIGFMAEAVTPDLYDSGPRLAERGIDLLEYGRGWNRYHDRIAPHCEQMGYRHLYPTGYQLLFPSQADFYRALADAKLIVCVPQSITHPEIAGTTETMPMRYLEVIASGAIPLGRCPADMLDLFGYNPVIEIDEDNPAGQLDEILANIDSLESLRQRNLETLHRVATWDRRADDFVAAMAANDPSLDFSMLRSS